MTVASSFYGGPDAWIEFEYDEIAPGQGPILGAHAENHSGRPFGILVERANGQLWATRTLVDEEVRDWNPIGPLAANLEELAYFVVVNG